MKRVLILLLFLVSSLISYGQDSLSVRDYSDRQDYEIGGVDVIGAESRDKNAIRSITGLTVGKKIKIPGPDIPKAIKSLWRLRLFEDIQIFQTKTLGDVVFLEIILRERPTLARYTYRGTKNSHHDDLNEIVQGILTKGSIVTDDQKELCIDRIKEFYHDRGKLDCKVSVQEILDTIKENTVRLVFDIDRGERVKVEDIVFDGNKELSDGKLRKAMHNTKKKGTFLRKTKYVKFLYEEDKRSVITEYNKQGFINARILGDSLWRDKKTGDLQIKIFVEEGNRFFFRDISWKGNSKYSDDQLGAILGIEEGDVYNPELLENRLRFSFDGRDISSLYMDDGYLGLNIDPVKTAVGSDSVDLEIQVAEGPQFTIDKVIIKGNDRTHEHVIRRAIRTRPGQKFSRAQIVRSQREIINLGYFNPEALDLQTPVNPQRGTVDIEYTVEERPSDQLELSAGYGGASGLLGTLGVTFNNFSVANIKNRETWSPLPQGDGQKLSLRVQSNSRFLNSYNFTFSEPWLGGKRPTAFTLSGVHTAFDYSSLGLGSLKISQLSIGLGTQLKWPDDFFSSSTALRLEFLRLNDYQRGEFFVEQGDRLLNIAHGNFKNFSIRQTFTRSSVSEPIYPRRGSRISLTMQVTPPYSLFRGDDYYLIAGIERDNLIKEENARRGSGNPLSSAEEDDFITSREQAKKFEWLEYHKWRIDGEWFFNFASKFVFYAGMKVGIIGAYNDDSGLSPFERFELGGDGLSNQSVGITGKDIISLRGYEVSDINQNNRGGATVFDKFTFEIRYPLSLNPNATIYLSTFLQGGNSWGSFDEFNPFDLHRSAGFGMRAFLPMFGLLGFDYGFGIDRGLPDGSGLSDYGKFSIILGFEPD